MEKGGISGEYIREREGAENTAFGLAFTPLPIALPHLLTLFIPDILTMPPSLVLLFCLPPLAHLLTLFIPLSIPPSVGYGSTGRARESGLS